MDHLRDITKGMRHVLIRGHLFTYAEKAPFVASGQSLLGALEYSQAEDLVKCHECGEWFHGLGTHIKAHGVTKAIYAKRHGLLINGALSSMGTREKQRSNAVRMVERGICAFVGDGFRRGRLPKGTRSLPTMELQNERGRCAAQLLFKIQTLALRLGHTPTQTNLAVAGISMSSIKQRFGSMLQALWYAGLNPNNNGNNRPAPLPLTFPSKAEIRKKFNERMPWPTGYFDAGTVALERRNS